MFMNRRGENNTVLVLGLAVVLVTLAGILATYGAYTLGYKQGKLETSTLVAQKTAPAPDAKAADAQKPPQKPTAAPVTPTTLGASAVPGLAGLSGSALENALQVVNSSVGPCDACVTAGLTIAACVNAQPACENMPRLVARVAREAKDGKSVADIQADVTYDEPWMKIDLAGLPVRGSAAAPITLVEASDFQCPFCSRAQTTIKGLEDKYGDKLRMVFLSQPLKMHQMAEPAAIAAQAAAEQGKFWEYHDELFARQKDLRSPTIFEDIATGLNMNLNRFKADLESADVKTKVSQATMLGGKYGVRGTPTFFVNGYRIRGAKPQGYFEHIIDLELADAR
jgi:protein-disulfide isomerase